MQHNVPKRVLGRIMAEKRDSTGRFVGFDQALLLDRSGTIYSFLLLAAGSFGLLLANSRGFKSHSMT